MPANRKSIVNYRYFPVYSRQTAKLLRQRKRTPQSMSLSRMVQRQAPVTVAVIVAFLLSTTTAFSSHNNAYLESLSKSVAATSSAAESNLPLHRNQDVSLSDTSTMIPDEHYSKDHPMAGWAGYKDPKWGGYLDNLASSMTESSFEAGKSSDYGDDVRWGAEVYLSNMHK